MDLLMTPPSIDLSNRDWVIHTRTEERPPVFLSKDPTIENSMISDGCRIESGAEIVNCVLSPGVIVESDAKVGKLNHSYRCLHREKCANI